MDHPAKARILGTTLGAAIGFLFGYCCSLIYDVSVFTRIISLLVVPVTVFVASWICGIIPYFRSNSYAAIMVAVSSVSVCGAS